MDFAAVLAQMSLFASLPPPAHLAAQAERCELDSGQCLYAEGDPPAYFYALMRGRLRVTSRGTLLGYVSRNEPVGEMGVVSGEPRNASVHAIRDSLLLRIRAADFLAFLRSESAALLDLTRLVIARHVDANFGERRIEELRRTYYCISTNLTTGATVVHDRGDLASWVGTSMCVPGVAPPVAWQGELLCDGGVVNNLPTDVMQNLERGVIIASNVSTEGDIRAPGAGLEQPDQAALLNWRASTASRACRRS